MDLSSIGENLALLNNGSNDDSVPATVPERESRLHCDRRFILELAAGSRQERLRPDPCYLTQASIMRDKVAVVALRAHLLPSSSRGAPCDRKNAAHRRAGIRS